jgi:hypothetical protein
VPRGEAASLRGLAALGAIGVRPGSAPPRRAVWRVTFRGALAMDGAIAQEIDGMMRQFSGANDYRWASDWSGGSLNGPAK